MKLLFIFFFAVSPNVFLLKSRVHVNYILKSNNCKVEKVDKDVMYCNCEDYYINLLFNEDGIYKGSTRIKK